MAKNQSKVSRRAWNILRLALLWARKGGVFKRRLLMDLRLVPKFIKGLAPSSAASSHAQIGFYGERELSFDKTPLFQMKMHRPTSMRFIIPCIARQQVDFDYDDYDHDHDHVYCNGETSTSGRKDGSGVHGSNDFDDHDDDNEYEGQYSGQYSDEDCSVVEEEEEEEAEGIDSRADKFIAQFYEQMKLQRQVSYLEYYKK